jgi:hypothetical protein
MQHLEPNNAPLRRFAGKAGLISLLLCAVGCGTNNTSTTPPATPIQGPQNYFAPYVAGTTNGGGKLTGPEIYGIDDHADVFTQSTFQLVAPQQQGTQVINVGDTKAGQRGLTNLQITTNYTVNSSLNVPAYVPMSLNPPNTGFAVELAGQAGGLVQIAGQPAAPLAAAVQCPNLKTAQTYQFITIPGGLIDSSTSGQQVGTWDPKTDTAYGSVDVSSNGSAVSLSNIHQYTVSSVGGSGVPAQQPSSPATGTCAPTAFGNTITVGQLTATNPTQGTALSGPPQASIAIGPTGLLVEHNGGGDATATVPGTNPALKYDNTLGAGTGAVGLPKPSSALDTSTLISAQYLGFVYGAGIYSSNSSTGPSGWSSHLASFGFSSTPSSCAAVAANTSTLIYGGDFTNDDPSTSASGFGNCDLAIDFGTQDPANNGRFPNATVWLGASYAANTTGKTYSFPAIAIAGQLNGKNAIFVLGVDSTEPWAIYLLQSN